MTLVYIEYISRRPGTSLEAFHKVMALGQNGWASEYGDDRLVLMLGRTWRIGPEPEYVCFWHTPNVGLARIDRWEEVFRSGAADAFEEPFRLAARIDKAGCYEPLIEPRASHAQHFYVEFFDLEPGASHSDIRDVYGARRRHSESTELCMLLDRVGHLGPDPRGIAVWSLPNWGALEVIARTPSREGPVCRQGAALYSPLGQETL